MNKGEGKFFAPQNGNRNRMLLLGRPAAVDRKCLQAMKQKGLAAKLLTKSHTSFSKVLTLAINKMGLCRTFIVAKEFKPNIIDFQTHK